jgi:hypothetical protein
MLLCISTSNLQTLMEGAYINYNHTATYSSILCALKNQSQVALCKPQDFVNLAVNKELFAIGTVHWKFVVWFQAEHRGLCLEWSIWRRVCVLLSFTTLGQVKTKGLLCPHLCLGQVYNSMENLIHLVILGPGMARLAVHHCALEHHAVPPSIQAIALSRPRPSRASVGTRESMPLCLGIPMYLPVRACCPPDCWIISSM